MDAGELQKVVDAVGGDAVCNALEWSRWTLARKLTGKSRIGRSEAFSLQALMFFHGAAASGRTIR